MTGVDRSTYTRNRRKENKTRALDYLGSCCVHCGTSDPRSLRFLHRPNTEVSFPISQGLEKSWDKIHPELDKCYLACRSCVANDGVPNPNVRLTGWTVSPLKPELSPQERRRQQLEERYMRAGEEIHADEAVRYHNMRVEGGWDMRTCRCDFCEDTRAGHELPDAYKERLKNLKDWKPDDLRKN